MPTAPDPVRDHAAMLMTLLAHPNVASKEAIVRRYDHEVRGGTIVRPFTGPALDGPADAAVLKPLGTWHHEMAFVLSAGVNPQIGRHDPWAMAISAIDEAFRNAVAVGGDPDRVAILDNFCWGNPMLPDRLGALVRCCQGCYDGALAYNTPFISGKDSLYNEFNGRPIPGTLLISAITVAPDLHRCTTADFKAAGNRIYLVGETRDELGGSLLRQVRGESGGTASALPDQPLLRYRALHGAMRGGLVQACHDLSEGGLAVALAEMALAGRLGAHIDLASLGDLPDDVLLYGESNGRLLVEVAEDDAGPFVAAMAGAPVAALGHVAADGTLVIRRGERLLFEVGVDELVRAWKGAA